VFSPGFLRLVLLALSAGETRVAGVVLAPDGGPLIGARVEIRCPGALRASYTDAGGRFAFAQLPSGRCTLRAVVPRLPPLIEELDLRPGVAVERRMAMPPPTLARVSVRVRVKAPIISTRPYILDIDIDHVDPGPCCWNLNR
jgi:hypothetical protein